MSTTRFDTAHESRTATDVTADPVETRAAVERMLVAHREEFLRFAQRRVPANVQADDLLQQVSLRALERATNLRDPEKARAWIYTMLRRVLVDARGIREIPVGDAPESSDETASAAEEPGGCACSMAILESLKPEYREALERVELGDEPITKLATDLGISANNATVRVHRARTAMRERLMNHCGVSTARECLDCSCDDHPCGSAAR
jgi:RNA polymerase sigma-70 factor (ECF subfamily)